MAADAMAPCVAMKSAVMQWNMHDKRVLVFYEEGFQPPTASQSQEMRENADISLHGPDT